MYLFPAAKQAMHSLSRNERIPDLSGFFKVPQKIFGWTTEQFHYVIDIS